MTHNDPAGSRIIAVSHHIVWESVAKVVNALGTTKAAHLKIRSGEHLAVVLASAFIGSPPIANDADGGTDIVFDLSATPRASALTLVGRTGARYVDFEVKSLPGPYREFDAAIDRAVAREQEPSQRSQVTRVVSINDVVRAGQPMIDKAVDQLRRKSSPERARNIFLVAHMLDHMFAEILDIVVAHHLDPLTDLPDEIDAVWILFAPLHLVVWSVAECRWTNLLYTAGPPDADYPGADDGVEVLVAVDDEFRRLIGSNEASPYAFRLIAGGTDGGSVAP